MKCPKCDSEIMDDGCDNCGFGYLTDEEKEQMILDMENLPRLEEHNDRN